MIEISVAGLSAGQRQIINNFHAHAGGNSLVIIGPTGSGKTLLAQTICGGIEDSEWFSAVGTVRLAQTALQLGKKTNKRIGYVPQIPSLYFVAPTVRDEFALAHACSAASISDAVDKTLASHRKTWLVDRLKLSPLQLSGGQQTLLMFEVTLGTEPDYLVVDGGIAALDATNRSRVISLVASWLAANTERRFLCFQTTDDAWFDFSARAFLPGLPPQASTGNSSTVEEHTSGELLRFEDVAAGPSFADRFLLQEISLTLQKGETIGLVGANGVGKSTLLRLVCGVEPLRRGNIFFGGQSIAKMRWPGLKGGIAYLPQEPEMAGPTTLNQLLSVGDLLEWCEFLEVPWSGELSHYWQLSAGQRAAATLAYLAHHKPLCWLLDEPTSRLSPAMLSNFLLRCRASDCSIGALLVSHDKDLLKATCSRILELTDGRIRAA